MKSTDDFKKVISQYLEDLAQNDELFAETLKKTNKSIEGCITYILNQVQKSGCNGFADAEIFGMAVHYYDEDDIKPGKPVNCQVVVNRSVELPELSPEDIEKAKQLAFDKIVEQEAQRIKKKPQKKQEQPVLVQSSLF
ncbi:PcfK-like family protein [Dyadobacter sp. LHD-138]|uniref:PcfK-like family protein n=1 Tax=Dyadobacter sp. LHD-138 TaxID=3071413 RepID=UPI0027E002FA|nr:PcfK-like family protein [Dyadobacter sp. LHD-138]MDQ6477821.1 PcfK-like family protein [Dyadobacter sp. LHD-138]